MGNPAVCPPFLLPLFLLGCVFQGWRKGTEQRPWLRTAQVLTRFLFPSWFDFWFITFHISSECLQTHRIGADLVLSHLYQLLALTRDGDWLPNTLKGRYYWDPLEIGSKVTTCKGAHSSPRCSYSRMHCSWLKIRFSCLEFQLQAGVLSALGDFSTLVSLSRRFESCDTCWQSPSWHLQVDPDV